MRSATLIGDRSRYASAALGQRADDRVQVVRLESVRRLVEIEQVGHAEQVDARGAQVGMVREQVEHGEPAGRAAHRHHPRADRPSRARAAARMPGRGVGRVEVAPPSGHRLRVRAAVAGRAPMVGEQHGPTALEEERQPVVPRDRWSVRSGRRGSTRAAAAGPRRSRTAPSARYRRPWTVAPSSASHVTAVGFGEVDRLEPADRAARRPSCARRARRRTRRSASASARRIARPRCGRPATTARRARPCRASPVSPVATSTQSIGPEAELVAGEHDRRAVRRPRERPLAETPRRVTVLDRLLDERLGVAAVGGRHPEVQPAGLVGEEREPRAVGREARLLHADAGAAGDDARRSPDPSASRTTMRPSSHGIAGTSHSCHTTRRPSGDHDGSKQKSASAGQPHRPRRAVDRRRRRRAAGRRRTRPRVPSGLTAGAAQPPAGCLGDDRRAARRSAGASHSPPSIAAYTSASAVGRPVERATAVRRDRTRRRIARDDQLRRHRPRHDDELAASCHVGDERDALAVGRQPRLGQHPPVRAHRGGDAWRRLRRSRQRTGFST